MAHVKLINVRLSFSDFRYQRIYTTVKRLLTKRFNLVRRANNSSITRRYFKVIYLRQLVIEINLDLKKTVLAHFGDNHDFKGNLN